MASGPGEAGSPAENSASGDEQNHPCHQNADSNHGCAPPTAIYVHALHTETSLWIRLGCVLTAVYLAWRVSQGRRVKVPPWKR